MTAPKSRGTKSKRDKRRSHIKLKELSLTKCKKCGKPVLPHTVCSACGYYKGRQIINIAEEKEEKKESKEKEKKPLDPKKLSKK